MTQRGDMYNIKMKEKGEESPNLNQEVIYIFIYIYISINIYVIEWNYYPVRCPNITYCMNHYCTYAHTENEARYHPLKFKIRLCVDGYCHKRDLPPNLCPYAHKVADLRSLQYIYGNGKKIDLTNIPVPHSNNNYPNNIQTPQVLQNNVDQASVLPHNNQFPRGEPSNSNVENENKLHYQNRRNTEVSNENYKQIKTELKKRKHEIKKLEV